MSSRRKVELDENRSDTVLGTSTLSEPQQSLEDVIVPQPVTQEPRRSDRIRKQPERYGFLISPHVDINLIEDERIRKRY